MFFFFFNVRNFFTRGTQKIKKEVNMPISLNSLNGPLHDGNSREEVRQKDLKRMEELKNKTSLNKEEKAELDALRQKYETNNYTLEKFMRGEDISLSQPSIWAQGNTAFKDLGKN